MRRYLQAILIAGLISFQAAGVQAATWTVERDGSGDFTVIQDAVDASASGDTILIGPGRYPELHSYTTPGGGWTGDVSVSIEDLDLTLIGSGEGVTVIGLEENPGTPLWPKGVVMLGEDRLLTIRNLSLENTYDGVYIQGSLDMRSTSIRGCDIGVVSFICPDIYIEGCEFANLDDTGITSYSGTEMLQVFDTLFKYTTGNVHTYGADAYLYRCNFEHSVGGAQFSSGSIATVIECEFFNIQNFGVASIYFAHVDIVDCVITGGIRGGILVRNNGSVTGSGNELSSNTGPVIEGGTHGSIELHGNHILSPVNNFVELDSYFETETYYLDLTGNFWGVTTAAEISSGIWDGFDDPEINAFVLFEPFSGDPISNEDMSWGELKQIYSH